ncbi:HET-s/LopB domain protein [Ophiocordyceps sinensis CO18]|uniref:HET-s/LopB domain protein n=1 Tax=Ophiocordyceps sinensis (strain Co18 / CGMCC 3.14243) TaxID=911162 RepID=T5ADH4_OPHSC|nr:HET-s/LopB domain protein [Ophiocordyceps sinensis CO18]
MDPLSIGGLAIGVASLGLQLLVTALGYDDECKYLNVRLRMEQQRLFAWSETSGLLDLDANNHEKILDSNMFNLHRQTILDLLVQVQCLFDDFTRYQRTHHNLCPVRDDDDLLGAPDKDAKQASFPISDRKRDFIKKAMTKLKSRGGWVRLRWTMIDKEAFEGLLAKFSALNDNMTNILDHSLQVEIRHTVHDTNRSVLLLHHKIADLSHLVLALNSQLHVGGGRATPAISRVSAREREASMGDLLQLATLARFKAFNENIDPKAGNPTRADAAAVEFLELAGPNQPCDLQVARQCIELVEGQEEAPRCEAFLKTTAEGGQETTTRVWIEWKDYDGVGSYPETLSKKDILNRVRKLASLLHHSPKPDAFRTPHCLGFFDKADPGVVEDDVDILDRRLGLIFERPSGDELDAVLAPLSLHDILEDSEFHKPRVTERVKLAHALSNCVLYLHAVNWLHKGLRSHNVLFFRTRAGHVNLDQPYLSGFDFSRPGGSEEMTDVPCDDAEHDLYRHPHTQCIRGRDRERFKKSFDIYSLGVILVELAHWKTVDRVLGIDLRRARGDHGIVRQVRRSLVARKSISDVGAEMGQRFEEATRTCLTGGLELGLNPGEDETADEVAERLSVRHYEDVVKKLGEVVV